ncbi:hypothetical protein [Streptomyces sp. 2131.1]|uniref:hypothetical protein n=1 Tax=Streptomyces sp. 2131.1 TaxID=1855346 RepID=UPI00159F892D|nr:hypothetical protein [Streptomyces sp. 2131.1]
MNSATEDGLISSVHLEGDPVRTCEPATASAPLPADGEQSEGVPEQPTIVRGQD